MAQAPKRIEKIEKEMVKQEESLAKIDAEMMSKGSDVEVSLSLSLSLSLSSCGCMGVYVCGCVEMVSKGSNVEVCVCERE